jgi:hypothetical protein
VPEIIISIFIIVFGVIVVLSALVFLVMEAMDKIESLRHRVPWLVRLIERRESLNVLLCVSVFLLLGNGYELVKKEVPEVPLPPPPAKLSPSVPTIVQLPPKIIPPALDTASPSDRYLNSEQREWLFGQLKAIYESTKDKRALAVRFMPAYPHDRETMRLLIQLSQIFANAKWPPCMCGQEMPNFEAPDRSGMIPIGVYVYSSQGSQVAMTVESFLINSGVGAQVRPAQEVGLPPNMPGVVVLIGYKSRPF